MTPLRIHCCLLQTDVEGDADVWSRVIELGTLIHVVFRSNKKLFGDRRTPQHFVLGNEHPLVRGHVEILPVSVVAVAFLSEVGMLDLGLMLVDRSEHVFNIVRIKYLM